MRDQLVRLLWFMNFFCEKVASSEPEYLGELVTVALLDPILLGHQACRPRIDPIDETVSNRKSPRGLQRRPATPGPMYSGMRTLSPLDATIKSKRFREAQVPVILTAKQDPLLKQPEACGRLKPIETTPPIASDNRRKVLPLDFYLEVESAIIHSNADECSYLFSSPEMKKLSVDEFQRLIRIAFNRFKLDNSKSKAMLTNVFESIICELIPQLYPESFGDAFFLIVQLTSVPGKLFTLACKHINLVSPAALNKIIEKMERKFVWERIETLGSSDLDRFNFMVMEIAANLENSEDLADLDHVTKVLESKADESVGKTFYTSLSTIQFIYTGTILLGALKHIDKTDETEEIRGAVGNIINFWKKELSLDTETILINFESAIKAFIARKTAEQDEPLGRFMKVLHELILKHGGAFPKSMEGIEDLYLYIKGNKINLVQTRLKYYRNSRLTKRQVLALLFVANMNKSSNPDLILVLLASVQIDQASMTEAEYRSLSDMAAISLKVLFTFPQRFEGDVCTTNKSLKQTELIKWSLPQDLFIPPVYSDIKDVYSLTDSILNLPRLFLYRVFGLPLMGFAEVYGVADELPEMQEMIDFANFFLERWCILSNSASFPIVKVIN